MIILYSKPCVFCGQRILVSQLKLCTPIHYLDFHRRSVRTSTCLSPEGMSNPSCYYPTQVFFSISCYATVRLYWTSSNGIEPTHQSPSMVIDHNHALTLIQCDVPVHMQCNAPLHVILCHMYNESYIDNIIHTTHWMSWTITSYAYDFHTSHHSYQYIIHTYIKINIQCVISCSSNDTHTIKPCNGHFHV